ncbi:MAG: hypothetical protein WCT04_15400 [Planctomycetota bacterium]
MKTMLTWILFLALGCLPALTAEPQDAEAAQMKGKMSAHMRALGNADGEALHMQGEMSMVKEGLLGTVNVLRELDVKIWTNRVTVTCNVEGKNNTKPDATIGGGSGFFDPKVDPSQPVVLTYTLPGLRTVSSLAICYRGDSEGPERLKLEGSADAGGTWFPIFEIRAKGLKCFKPVKVNALRLTQEGGSRRTKEVAVYADPETPLPLFGGKDSGAFSFHRALWYADKLKVVWSPENKVWTTLDSPKLGINRLPETVLFGANLPNQHTGGFGHAVTKGKRLYVRFDLDKACPMNFGAIYMPAGDNIDPKRGGIGLHPAEFYTANGPLDPGTLPGSSIQDITDQGWILQKAWDKDSSTRKDFQFAHPGPFNQMLVVWDAFTDYGNDAWCHLEIFGSRNPDAGDAPKSPQK